VFVLTLQPIAFALGFATLLFRARQFFAQARDLMLLVLDQIVAIITRWLRAPQAHMRYAISPKFVQVRFLGSSALMLVDPLNEDQGEANKEEMHALVRSGCVTSLLACGSISHKECRR
jgi:hypothetical protein